MCRLLEVTAADKASLSSVIMERGGVTSTFEEVAITKRFQEVDSSVADVAS